MISFQTNVNSIIAQRNLDIDNQSQTKTIQQLSSGYRINSSAADPAGVAIANSYSDSIAEVNQGVANANGAIGQLQILDGGLANISTVLDRMKILATESASSTFTGDRNTLNQEYTKLLAELNRQTSNIGLNSGGDFNSVLKILVGGGKTANDSMVTVDLSGIENAVDASSLGLSNTNVLNTGIGLINNNKRLDTPGATFLSGIATASQSFTFNVDTAAGAQTITATANGSVAGITKEQAISQLAAQLNPYGIDVDVDDAGLLQFTGTTPFNNENVAVPGGGAPVSSSLVTNGFYYIDGFFGGFSGPAASDSETLNITIGGTTIPVVLNSTDASSVSAGVLCSRHYGKHTGRAQLDPLEQFKLCGLRSSCFAEYAGPGELNYPCRWEVPERGIDSCRPSIPRNRCSRNQCANFQVRCLRPYQLGRDRH